MFESFYKYIVTFFRDKKVIHIYFCNTVDEIKVLRALAHFKKCECEVSCLIQEKPIVKHEPEHSSVPVEERKKKKNWRVPCKCVETGKVYESVAACSKETGIKQRSIDNAIKHGTPRRGLHFVKINQMPSGFSNSNKINTKRECLRVPYMCITTGEIFNSVSDIFKKYNFGKASFYRAIKHEKEINGLRFEKIDKNSRRSSQTAC